MSVVVCGSMAYDNLMEFDGEFGDFILPDQLHILSVAFTVPRLRKEFGGCAGNIAFNMKMLGMDPIICATVGKDFSEYHAWLESNEISTSGIKVIDHMYTAQCFITTDQKNNQLTSFHPGAMDEGHNNPIPNIDGIDMVILSPDGKAGTISHANEMHQRGVPIMYDPGQGLPMFDKAEILSFIDQAKWIILNEYEANLISEITELSLDQIKSQVSALIVTKGGDGSNIYIGDEVILVDPIQVEKEADPTGCGDAYRAGLIYGMINDFGMEKSGKLGSILGSIKVQSHGTQNHQFEPEKLLSML